jgi:hypothetical protein
MISLITYTETSFIHLLTYNTIHACSYLYSHHEESNLPQLSKGCVITENRVQAEFVSNTPVIKIYLEVHTLGSISSTWPEK